MNKADNQDKAPISRAWLWCTANRHFMVAAIILGLTAAGWGVAIDLLQWATHKEPVPWPDCVIVDDATFRNVSFPTKLGPYVRAEDGQLDRNADLTPKKDGRPDGELILDETVMEPLKIGTWLDKSRIAERRSNWYLSRIYIDTRKNKRARRYLQWRVNVTYYTGGLDKVPHVPDACLVAGGATIVDASDVKFSVLAARRPWDEPVTFGRTLYERHDRQNQQTVQYVQYYAFSLNGEPEANRLTVRRKLAYPWVRYCYFAKIQFGPLSPITNSEEADAAANEFLNYLLPEVLQTLPSSKDVSKLNSARKEKE